MLRTHAVVLRRIEYSETSQVLHLYTRDNGKVHAIAKGARRRRNAFSGPFDLFALYEILHIEKRPGQLDVLTSADLLRDFPALRSRYDRFCAGSYLCDLVDTLTLEGQKQPELFDLLVQTFEALDSAADIVPILFRFEARLLLFLGHFPRLADCGICRRAIGGREAYFSCRDGGAVCLSCRPRDPRRIQVPCDVLGVLSRFRTSEATVRLNPAWIDPLRRILDDYIRFLAESEPKSMRFVREEVLRSARTPELTR